jgi:RNA polymerase sigma-70 factor (ECF subfamily)
LRGNRPTIDARDYRGRFMADGFNDSYSGAFAIPIPPAAPLAVTNPNYGEDFDRFYREQWPRVRRFLQSRRLQPQVVEDLTQETFLRAYRGFPKFSKRGISAAEASWVRTIAVRLWHNWHRDNLGEAGQMPVADPESEETFDPPDPEVVDVVQKLILEELQSAMPGKLAQLPPGQQEVLRLWIEGKSYEQICAATGKSMQNVKATLHKAKEKLAHLVRQLNWPHNARPVS